MKAVIVTGGKAPSEELLLRSIEDGDYIIGVDKGCNTLYKYGIKPSIILGDFDSIDSKVLDEYIKLKIPSIKFNPEKDYTDSDLAYEKAKEINPSKIIFLGATGTRYDHALGNIGILLKSLREGYKTEIVDENNRMFVVNKNSSFEGDFGHTISFHALSDKVAKFNISGGKYDLKDYDMTLLEPRAVCNEFLDTNINISFESGIILVIYPKD